MRHAGSSSGSTTQGRRRIWTVGHSTPPLPVFLDPVKHVDLLTDVPPFPASRRFSRFSQGSLEPVKPSGGFRTWAGAAPEAGNGRRRCATRPSGPSPTLGRRRPSAKRSRDWSRSPRNGGPRSCAPKRSGSAATGCCSRTRFWPRDGKSCTCPGTSLTRRPRAHAWWTGRCAIRPLQRDLGRMPTPPLVSRIASSTWSSLRMS